MEILFRMLRALGTNQAPCRVFPHPCSESSCNDRRFSLRIPIRIRRWLASALICIRLLIHCHCINSTRNTDRIMLKLILAAFKFSTHTRTIPIRIRSAFIIFVLNLRKLCKAVTLTESLLRVRSSREYFCFVLKPSLWRSSILWHVTKTLLSVTTTALNIDLVCGHIGPMPAIKHVTLFPLLYNSFTTSHHGS